MSSIRWAAVAATLAAAWTASGCALLVIGGAGAAGYAYVNGKCEKSYPYPLTQTWPAVHDAVQSMGLPVYRESADALSARLESRTVDGDKITITLEAKGTTVTEVQIRVGVFGDENASHLILNRIDERLPGASARFHPDTHFGVSVSR